MAWARALTVLILLAAGGITLVLALVALHRRAIAGALEFGLLSVAGTIWAWAGVFHELSTTLAGKLFWTKASYLGIATVPVLWYLFIRKQINLQRPLRYWQRYLIWIIPIITLALVFTTELQPWYYTRVALIQTSAGIAAIYGHGPWFWVNSVYSYVLLMAGTIWLLAAIGNASALHRRQLAVIAAGTAIPWLGNVLCFLGLSPVPGLDVTPLTFGLAGLVYAWAIFRLELFQLVPVARQTLIMEMSDGVLMVNTEGCILDVNPAAQRLLGVDALAVVGKDVSDVFVSWTDLDGHRYDLAALTAGGVTVKAGAQYLDIHVSPLRGMREELTGRLLIIHDVTEQRQADAALRESQRAFATLVSTLPGMAYRCQNNPEWTMQFVSEGCYDLTGYQAEDLVQNQRVAYGSLIHPQDREQVWKQVQKQVRIHQPFKFTYRILTANNEVKWVWEQGQGVYDENGDLLALEGFISDVTERMQTEEALRESEARYRAIFEHAQEGISFYLEQPDGSRKLLDCNASYVAQSGFPREELLRMGDTRAIQAGHITPETASRLASKAQPGESYAGAFSWLRPDGRENLIEYTAMPVETEAGTVTIGIDRDVTERARSEKAEREQRRLAEALRKAAAVLNSTLDLEAVLDRILEQIGLVIDYDVAAILLSDGRRARVARWRESGNISGANWEGLGWDILTTKNLCDMVESGQPAVISDTYADPNWLRPPQVEWVGSYAGTPICSAEEVLGFLEVVSARPGFYTPQDGDRLHAFADQAALALRNARLFADARRRAEQMTMLNRIGAAITSGLSMDQVLRTIHEQCRQIVAMDSFYIALYDQHTDTIRFPLFWDGDQVVKLPAANLRIQPGLTGAVIDGKRTIHIADALGDAHSDPDGHYQFKRVGTATRCYLGVPLIVRDQVVGVLSAQSLQPDAFSPEQRSMFETIATQAAVAIDNAQLYEQVQYEKRYFETLVANSPVGIIAIDREGRVISWNPAAERIFGYTDEEAVGRNIDLLIASASPAMLKEGTRLTSEAFGIEQVSHRITQRKRKDGSLVDVEIFATPQAVGLDRGLILTYYDITELQATRQTVERFNEELRQRLQQLDQANAILQAHNEELDAFAHTVAHDLRSPLHNIVGYADLLRWDAPGMSGQEVAGLAAEILQQGRRMRNIIDELLLLATVRKEDVKAQPLPMYDIAAEALERLTDLIIRSDAEIVTPDTWPTALGYASWVEEVWVNYVSNAITYGGKPPKVELGADMPTDGMVRFWVRDNGAGMAPEIKERLFTPFTRLSQVRSSGYGLGLSIVQRIVSKLGGEVGAESDECGSLFYFTLPIAVE